MAKYTKKAVNIPITTFNMLNSGIAPKSIMNAGISITAPPSNPMRITAIRAIMTIKKKSPIITGFPNVVMNELPISVSNADIVYLPVTNSIIARIRNMLKNPQIIILTSAGSVLSNK